LESQAQYIAAERSQVWVNIGYRLSVFGFLACDMPIIEGNFGFKDQWVALEWIRDNIGAFGGTIGGSAWARNSHSSTRQETHKTFKSQVYQQVSAMPLSEHMGYI
jgi:carboxylesterase type B